MNQPRHPNRLYARTTRSEAEVDLTGAHPDARSVDLRQFLSETAQDPVTIYITYRLL